MASHNTGFMQPLPHDHGSYGLVLFLPLSLSMEVGRLGRLSFDPGHYLYVGSAFGPGGLAARVGHHARRTAKPHWHIDYFRAIAVLREVWYTKDNEKREHHWADVLTGLSDRSIPGFGSTDCQCMTHLFYTRAPMLFDQFRNLCLARFTPHAPVMRLC